MEAVEMTAFASSASTDVWYVTNGVVAVGPVAFTLLSRGIASGRIPPASFIRHESWKVWRRLRDIEELSTSARDRTVNHLASITASAEEKASSPYHEPPAEPTGEVEVAEPEPHSEDRPSTIRPIAVDPVGVLGHAVDLDEALLLALSTAATASSADVAVLHRIRPENGLLFTACGHGPGSELILGNALSAEDPCVMAAQSRRTVVGEPVLGEAGRRIAARLHPCVGPVRGVAMVPINFRDELLGMIEVARIGRPFRAREVARIEDVAEALVGRISVEGWLD